MTEVEHIILGVALGIALGAYVVALIALHKAWNKNP